MVSKAQVIIYMLTFNYCIMKKFLLRLAVFIFGVLIIDFSFGMVVRYLLENTKPGAIQRDDYISNKCCADLMVFGSSRGHHHYNTQMMTDSLDIDCYNCSQHGCGSVLAYARLLMIKQRFVPKYIIYDVYPGNDYLTQVGYFATLSYLRLHYDQPCVDSILWEIDPAERIKMLSAIHRYKDHFKSINEYFKTDSINYGICGYVPEDIRFDSLKVDLSKRFYYDRVDGYEYDKFKLKCLRNFAKRSRDINVVFVVSPVWYGMDTMVLDSVKQICVENDIKLLDYSNDPKYVHNDAFFRDGAHLNARGADEFTRDLIKRLKEEGSLEVKRK